MFAKSKILAVTKQGSVTPAQPRQQLNASAQGGGLSTSLFMGSQYQYMMNGLLPAGPENNDSTSLALFYRDIYSFDNVAGSAVDIQSSFPFSDWELRGLDDRELKIFNDGLERLNLRELLPQLSTSYLVDGFYAGSLVFDAKAKNFMDVLTHDAIQCTMTPTGFNNVDPEIHVTVSGGMSQFLNSASPYSQKYLETMPLSLQELLRQGAFTLDPVTTLFVARRALTDRAYMSYLHRILPMYLIEKTMFRGTLVEAMRRQRAMTHVQAGDETWIPSEDELGAIVEQFRMAEMDPNGGWISTRNAVQVSNINAGGEFWKWTDMADVLVAYKLRALGISEALLSGDASYAAAESAYSTFLETCNGYRTHLTNSIFYRKTFPLLAVANSLYKDDSKKRTTRSTLDFLFNTTNRNNLKIPQLHWHKDLTAKSEDNMMETLEKISEKGLPIPIKTWVAAAGLDIAALKRDQKDDAETRKHLGMAPAGAGGEGGQEGELGEDGQQTAHTLTSTSINHGPRNRQSLLDRDFSMELFNLTKTGQKRHVHNANAKMKDINWRIAKIGARMENDQNYREEVRKRNLAKFGKDRLDGL